MTYYKDEKVRINQAIVLKERSASLTKQNEDYYLHIGEIFTCADHTQPDFMDYLNVYCEKRRKHFVLPMSIVVKKS
jgi:hypothetical protein